MSSVEVLETPVKSENDKKSYRLIRLENGLKALLISAPSTKAASTEHPSNGDEQSKSASDNGDQAKEPDSKLAACAICVDVGSLSDPLDAQGMAHFLEHLVFLGSEKYPNENVFEEFMQKTGGDSNAETRASDTTFYFKVPEQFLEASIDRMANLLKSPLLLKDSMMREREAVDSEFANEKISDYLHRRELVALLTQPGHPYAKFACGNLKSLKDKIDDDVLHVKVKDFKARHYSAHRMSGCVQSTQSLDALQEMIVQHFSDMPNNGLPGDDFSTFNHQNSFQSKFHEKVYFVKPLQKVYHIVVTWCMESDILTYKSKPYDYVTNLLECEGKGSLMSYLRKKLWADELAVDTDVSIPNMFTLFSVNIRLTEDGFNHMDEVLEAIFSYLKLIQTVGPNEATFNELQNIKVNRFKFAPEEGAFDNVQSVAKNLKLYPAKDILTGSKLLFEYDSDAIRKYIDDLNSKKFNIMISSPRPYNEQVTFESTHPWLETKYTELIVPNEWIDLWKNAKPLAEFALPEPNPFIADDFTIFYEAGSTVPKYPTKILDNDLGELWFRQDDKFLLPTAYCKFQFVSPYFHASAKNAALTSILSRMLEYQFVDEMYPAKAAGLDYECFSSNSGLFFEVSGFNQKLHLVVDIFRNHLKLLVNESTESEFSLAVQQELKDNESKLFFPGWLTSLLSTNAHQHNRPPTYEKNKFLHSLTFADFQKFCRNFGKEMRLKALIQGNVTESHALSVMNTMLDELNFKKIEDPSTVQLRGLKFPIVSNYLRCKSFSTQNVNSSILNVYQIGPFSYETNALLSLLKTVANEQCFYNLRTVEHLAYSVSFETYKTHNVVGYQICVDSQESKFAAEYVDERIENFRRTLITTIENMSDDDFDAFKMSLAKIKLTDLNDLNEEGRNNWDEIETNQYEFDRRYKEVECLSTVTKNKLLEFYRANYGQNERKLSIQIIGNAHANEANGMDVASQQNMSLDRLWYVGFNSEPKGHLIEGFLTFKNTLEVYPIESPKNY